MAKTKFNYDYSKILWMKMFLAKPDFPNNKSEVLINFEQALEIVKGIDNITQGIPKMVEKVNGIYPMLSSQMQKYITSPLTETNISVMPQLPIKKSNTALNPVRQLQ